MVGEESDENVDVKTKVKWFGEQIEKKMEQSWTKKMVKTLIEKW